MGEPPLNSYVVDRLDDNGGKLTLGIVLTAECFVHGDVNSQENTCGKYNIDNALHVIARYDSLRMNDEENIGGWYIDGSDKNCILYIPVEMLGIKENEDGTPASNIPSDWSKTSEIFEFRAPNNWATFEKAYNDLKDACLIDFDLNGGVINDDGFGEERGYMIGRKLLRGICLFTALLAAGCGKNLESG